MDEIDKNFQNILKEIKPKVLDVRKLKKDKTILIDTYSYKDFKKFVKEISDVSIPKDKRCFGCTGKKIEGKETMCWHCSMIYAQGFDYGTELEKKDSIPKEDWVKQGLALVPLDSMIHKDSLREKITRTIKLYPHKHGDELVSEIMEYLDRGEE